MFENLKQTISQLLTWFHHLIRSSLFKYFFFSPQRYQVKALNSNSNESS
jgi:hypothetical protein